MGLFFNYSNPGPGIEKDAPKKKGVFLYLEILARKFTKLFTLNLLYFIFSLPMILIYFMIFLLMIPNIIISLFMSFAFTIMLGSGPASAGMAYIMRQFSREEHVWLASSFFGKMKENFKQEIIVAIVDLLFAFIFAFSAVSYYSQYILTGSLMWFVLLILLLGFSFFFVSTHYYIHQLIVTFENNIKDIYKNAMLFAMTTTIQNVLLTAFTLGILYAVFDFLTPVFSIILSALILIAFLRFSVEFFAQNTIKKVMKPQTEEPDDNEEIIFSDSHGSEK